MSRSRSGCPTLILNERRRLAEERRKCGVRQVEIEPARVHRNGRPAAAEEPPQRQARRFREQVPACLLNRFFERQGHAPCIAAARPHDPMDDGTRLLRLQTRPRLLAKNAVDFGFGRQRLKQRLHETQTHDL